MESRNQKLEAIRAEIVKLISEEATLDVTEWLRKFPELQPELGQLLSEIVGSSILAPTMDTLPCQTSDPNTVSVVHDPDQAATVAFSSTTGSSTGPNSGEATELYVASGESDSKKIEPGRSSSVTGDEKTAIWNPNSHEVSGAFGEVTYNGTTMSSAPVKGSPSSPAQPGQRVRYLGDYELLQILGQGGMGVVFRARQVSLNRQVALKMIKNSEFATGDQLRRFQNEAEAVAKLDHPAIVPIYEVGEYQDEHYFSMKLVDGGSMEKVLEDLQGNPREIARIMSGVADAIHHAHQRGILHRDLKPANILLDSQMNPHVTDFGLAKQLDKQEGLTVDGAILGTAGYMSPEQAQGVSSAITTSSDIYGLGAMLFAALTRQAPFKGNSLMQTLDMVRHKPAEPPSRLYPEVPRDLEVICLKCLEKDPRRRYSTAADFSNDLHRWLKGEPISARPVSRAIRLAMWARRKPALAGLSASLILATVLGIAGITWQWREAVFQRDQKVVALKDAIRQEQIALKAEKEASLARDEAISSEKEAISARNEATQNAKLAGIQGALALGTIQDLITRVNTGMDQPRLFKLKREILESALERVDQVANTFQGVTSKEATTLAALTEMGRIFRQTGRIDKALPIFQRCEEIAKERIIIKQGNDSSRNNLANIYRELAYCAEENDRDMKSVVEHLHKAINLYDDILVNSVNEEGGPSPVIIKLALADTYTHLGTAHHHLGEIPHALEAFSKAFNLKREVLASQKDNIDLIRSTALSALALADCSSRLGRRDAADDYYRQSGEFYAEVAEADPGSQATKIDWGNYHAAMGNDQFRMGNLASARTHFESSHKNFEEVVQADPDLATQKRELAAATARIAQLADVANNPDLARKEYEKAVSLAEELYKLDEKNDLRVTELMLLLPHVGQVNRALEMADRLAAGPKIDTELWTYLAQVYAQAARSLPPQQAGKAGDLESKAMNALRQAVKQGFRDRTVLDYEHDLDPLRNREDFKALLNELPVTQ